MIFHSTITQEELRKTDFADITQPQIHVRVSDLSAAESFATNEPLITPAAKRSYIPRSQPK